MMSGMIWPGLGDAEMTKKEYKEELIEDIIRLNPFWLDTEENREELEGHSLQWLEDLAEFSRWEYRDRYR